MFNLQGVEMSQINCWLAIVLSTIHPFSIQVNYLDVLLKTSDRTLENISGPTKNKDTHITMPAKQKFPSVTLANTVSPIQACMRKIRYVSTSTVCKNIMVH